MDGHRFWHLPEANFISQSLVERLQLLGIICFFFLYFLSLDSNFPQLTSEGAFHYAKDSANFGKNSNKKVRFGFI